MPELAPGYQLLREVGRGGAGIVYQARARDGRDVAVKVLAGDASREVVERFTRERRLLEELSSVGGFVPLLDSGRTPLGPFFVMPLLRGGTLRDRLQRGPLGVDETVALGRSIARAMSRAHDRGVVHRDLKPENILFDDAGAPLVADLGLAKHFTSDAPGASRSVALSKTGDFRGTAGFMAPEQLAASRDVGPEADVFSMGAILYEALTGGPAFPGEDFLSVVDKVTRGRFEPVARARPDAPRWLAGTIERALAVEPTSRFGDAGELLAALEMARPVGRRRAPLVVGAALVLGAAATAAVVMMRPAPPVPRPPAPAPPPTPSADLPAGLRLAGKSVPAANGAEVPLHLFRLPDGGDMEVVRVPPGAFTVGTDAADASEGERPSHASAVEREVWIGRNDVTWSQFLAYCKATGSREPERTYWTRPTHPVVNVSAEEARAYCAWAKLALPLDLEWEKAARGTDGRTFPWGNDWQSDCCNFADRRAPLRFPLQPGIDFELTRDVNADDGFPFTSPAGQYPRGVSPYGALDMAGNVWQWCARGSGETLRGGCWASERKDCRTFVRMEDVIVVHPSSAPYMGFRVALRR